jgi:hypothetical protein
VERGLTARGAGTLLLCGDVMGGGGSRLYGYLPDALRRAYDEQLYKQTTGAHGYVKTLVSSAIAAVGRGTQESIATLGQNMIMKAYPWARRLPPENR